MLPRETPAAREPGGDIRDGAGRQEAGEKCRRAWHVNLWAAHPTSRHRQPSRASLLSLPVSGPPLLTPSPPFCEPRMSNLSPAVFNLHLSSFLPSLIGWDFARVVTPHLHTWL